MKMLRKTLVSLMNVNIFPTFCHTIILLIASNSMAPLVATYHSLYSGSHLDSCTKLDPEIKKGYLKCKGSITFFDLTNLTNY